MSIFPFMGTVEVKTTTNNNLPLYKEVAWDYLNDSAIFLDGKPKMVEGVEAICVWIYKAIKTVRYEHEIYGDDYGCEIMSLMGQGFSKGLVESEVKRYVREALEVNEYITDIPRIEVDFKGDTLTVKVDVITVYGKSEVVADV